MGINVIAGERGSGKSEELISDCLAGGGMLVVVNHKRKKDLIARHAGLLEDNVMTFSEFLRIDSTSRLSGRSGKLLYIDDVDLLIQQLANIKMAKLAAMSVTVTEAP